MFKFLKILFLMLAIFFVACKPQTKNQLNIVLENQNIKVGRSNLVFKIERNGQPLVAASVSISGDMTHPGMSPVVGTATELGAGRYEIKNFEITMGGDWILSVVAKQNGQTFLGQTQFGAQ